MGEILCWFKSSRPQPHKTPLGKKLPDGVLLCPDRRIASVTMLLTMLFRNGCAMGNCFHGTSKIPRGFIYVSFFMKITYKTHLP